MCTFFSTFRVPGALPNFDTKGFAKQAFLYFNGGNKRGKIRKKLWKRVRNFGLSCTRGFAKTERAGGYGIRVHAYSFDSSITTISVDANYMVGVFKICEVTNPPARCRQSFSVGARGKDNTGQGYILSR